MYRGQHDEYMGTTEMPTLPILRRRLPIFVNILHPFCHQNLATSLFLASFVPLKLHVILKPPYFCLNRTYFLMLMLALVVQH